MLDIVEVYHGGTIEIPFPKVDVGRPNLDFGPGFYITDIYTQAESWARRMASERNEQPIVNIYRLHRNNIINGSRHKTFRSYDKEWLDFITDSRLGLSPWNNLDYIEGGVADDRIFDTIRLYMSGLFSAENALERLKYFKPANQICILNQSILDANLEYIESKVLSNE